MVYKNLSPNTLNNISNNNHSQFHSVNAFCGNAGKEEMEHLSELVSKLSDDELILLVKNVGIKFAVDKRLLNREDYENVIDEADREDFYREYRKITSSRSKNKR